MDTFWALGGLEVIWMRPVGGGAKVSYNEKLRWQREYKRRKAGAA